MCVYNKYNYSAEQVVKGIRNGKNTCFRFHVKKNRIDVLKVM
jgi:hypothetical protein